MKRICSLFLIIIMLLINTVPAIAEEKDENGSTTLTSSVEKDRVFIDSNTIFQLAYESDLDVNETKVGEEVFFKLLSPVKASNGKYLPANTRFAGKFKKVKPSSPLFKRARAYIIIDKILLQNGTEYTIRMEPKSGSDLKSSQVLNTIRAVPAGIGIVTFSVISVAAVAIESVSVVGLVVVRPTCKGFGLLISSMAKGLNYKAKAGSKILFKLDTPLYISSDDLI